MLVDYVLMPGTGVSAVFYVQTSSDRMAMIGLLGWVVIYTLLVVGVHRLEKGKMESKKGKIYPGSLPYWPDRARPCYTR